MTRLLVTAAWALALQMLVAISAVRGGEPPDPTKPPKAKLDVTITLHFPAETPWAAAKKTLEGLEALKVKQTLVRAPKTGKGPYAEVVAAPRVRSQDVAVVVRTLLDLGMTKIAIEVKK